MIIDEEDGGEQCMYDTGKRWMTGWGGGGAKTGRLEDGWFKGAEGGSVS